MKCEILKVQWNAAPQGASPATYQTQGLLSPSYGGTTYSFTADFRPPQEAPVLTSYKSVPMSFSSPRRRHSVNLIEDDNQKPNVCRICGKFVCSSMNLHLVIIDFSHFCGSSSVDRDGVVIQPRDFFVKIEYLSRDWIGSFVS